MQTVPISKTSAVSSNHYLKISILPLFVDLLCDYQCEIVNIYKNKVVCERDTCV